MTHDQLAERLKEVNGSLIATIGYLDMIQDPPPEMQIDKDATLVRAFENAERALRLLHQLQRDSWAERHSIP
jgi:hypothetical protein